MQDTIFILDFDTALAGLIARTLRSQQIYCEAVPGTISLATVLARAPKGLILAAGPLQPQSLAELDLRLLDADLPVLALGALTPLLCEHLGGKTGLLETESESITLELVDTPLFEGIADGERVLHDWRDVIVSEGLSSIATATQRCIGFASEAHHLYAVQYPIERNDPDAIQMLANFAQLVCGVTPDWTEERIIQDAVEAIRTIAGENRVLCAVSGGVDSAVCAKLAHMAVGNRLMCVFVDTGLMRKDEPQNVIRNYMETLGFVVAYVDAQELFLKALRGVRSAAEKEHIASTLLHRQLFSQLGFDPQLHTLVLGTNYSDALYGDTANVPLPETSAGEPLRIAEPIRALFKDEVRRLAKALSLPDTVTERQPFPASGLALRVFGEVTEEKLEILRQADAFFSEEIRAGGHERRLWQYFALLCENPDMVGGYTVILRAAQACRGEACASRLPYDLLERVTERILDELPLVTKVMYDLTPSPNVTMLE